MDEKCTGEAQEGWKRLPHMGQSSFGYFEDVKPCGGEALGEQQNQWWPPLGSVVSTGRVLRTCLLR